MTEYPLYNRLVDATLPVVSESEKWFSIASAVRTDTHPGSALIRENLPHIRRIHESHPHSKLILIGGRYEDVWHGAAGVYSACNIVTVTFMFVKPIHRGNDVFLGLLNAIRRYGQNFYYGFVRIPCPVVTGLESLHETFGTPFACHAESYMLPGGTEVVSYLLTRHTFESLFQ